MSRRPLDPNAKRSRSITLHLQPVEYRMLQALAYHGGTNPSELIHAWLESVWNDEALTSFENAMKRLPPALRPWYRGGRKKKA